MLDANLSVREKIPLAWEIRNVMVDAADGEVPDLGEAFAKRDVESKPELARVQTDLTAAISDTLTRAFRSSFLIAAALGALALIPGWFACRRARAPAKRNVGGAMALVALGAVSIGLIGTEVAAGAADFGRAELVDPCTAPVSPYDGDGIDGAVQRIALGGLNGAACELGVGREELVLSLDPDSGAGVIDWDSDTVQDAVRAGTIRAIEDAENRDTLPGWAASALTWVVERAPISWFLENISLDFLEDIPFVDEVSEFFEDVARLFFDLRCDLVDERAAQCAAGCAKHRLSSEASRSRAEPGDETERAAQCAAGCAKHRLSSEASRSRAEHGRDGRRRSAPPGARSTDCRAKRAGAGRSTATRIRSCSRR